MIAFGVVKNPAIGLQHFDDFATAYDVYHTHKTMHCQVRIVLGESRR